MDAPACNVIESTKNTHIPNSITATAIISYRGTGFLKIKIKKMQAKIGDVYIKTTALTAVVNVFATTKKVVAHAYATIAVLNHRVFSILGSDLKKTM